MQCSNSKVEYFYLMANA